MTTRQHDNMTTSQQTSTQRHGVVTALMLYHGGIASNDAHEQTDVKHQRAHVEAPAIDETSFWSKVKWTVDPPRQTTP
jgi:hypothetical protein